MTFTEHLAELRTRIIRSAIAVAAGFVLCYIFSDQIFNVIARPLLPRGTLIFKWVALTPTEAFWVKLRLSGYCGVLLALPVIMYQMCAFIFPGLTKAERGVIRVMLGGCAAFAVFGVLVAYFGVFPLFLPYLTQWVPAAVEQQFRMSETISLILMFLLGFALAFQFPMIVLVLVYLDLLTPAGLKRLRRPAIIIMAVVAAVLTPPDPISMMMMLIPMVILYEISILMSYIVIRRKRKQKDPTSST